VDKLEMTRLRRDLQIVLGSISQLGSSSMSIGDSIMEPLAFMSLIWLWMSTGQVTLMMHRVGLDQSDQSLPHELSGEPEPAGGYCSRNDSATARLLICDEAVSALDVSIQAQIVDLIKACNRNSSYH
jgi:ABC-type glutathione transport system ATPase component